MLSLKQKPALLITSLRFAFMSINFLKLPLKSKNVGLLGPPMTKIVLFKVG